MKAPSPPILTRRTLLLLVTTTLALSACTTAQNHPPSPSASNLTLSREQLASVGHRVWQNESGGTVEGLAAWNSGENFASLGIGHFIWYPAGPRGPFKESFPHLIHCLQQHQVPLPTWLTPSTACPWPDRASFLSDRTGRVTELRQLLARTVDIQTQFLLQRLNTALPKMLAAAAPQLHNKITINFQTLAQTPAGAYALIDYVNFKGEGVNPSERYNGQGWGLLQVLTDMNAPTSAEFSTAAARVLRQRAHNSPPARNENKWLPGWLNRCHTYGN